MSLSSTANRDDFTGDGTTSNFLYTFKVFAATDLLLTITNIDSPPVETTLVLTTDYTVNGVNDKDGGSIDLVDTGQAYLDGDGDLLTGFIITLRRVRPLTQITDLRNQGPYFPATVEDQFDKNVMIAQQQQEEIDRSVKNPEGLELANFDPTLPTDINTADVTLIVNSGGTAFEVGPTGAQIAGANASAIAAAASAAAALVSENAAAADAVLTAADAVSTAADAVSTAADRVQTGLDATATGADAVSTAADAVSTAADASAASTSASNAATSETNAATSETNAATSETNAATSETNAATSETNAGISETNAAASAAAASGNEPSTLHDVGIKAAAAAGALTVSLVRADGITDGSLADPLVISHLKNTLTTGGFNLNTVTAALSAVIPSTALLGFIDLDDVEVHVFGIDNAGVEEIALAGSHIFSEKERHNTTILDTSSDLGTVLYSTVARSDVTIRYIGVMKLDAIVTAGTWVAPDEIRLNQGQETEDEFLSVELTANTVTVTATTPVDVSGSNIVLRPGKWTMGHNLAVGLNDDSGATNNILGKVHMTDAANNDVNGTAALIRSSNLASDETIVMSVARQIEITVTSTTTFKLRVECSDTVTTGGTCTVFGVANISGALTDPDNESTIWARRVTL